MKTLRLSTPEDLIAVIPTLLGFHPHDSVVVVAKGGRDFQCRVDLPRPGDPQDCVQQVVAALVQPMRRQRTASVVLAYYCEEHARARRMHRALARALEREGVRVLEALQVAAGRYCSHLPQGRPQWVDHDCSLHPLALEAVVDGRQVAGDRAGLVAELATDAEAETTMAGLLPLVADTDARTGDGPDEVAWSRATVTSLVDSGERPDAETTARLLSGLRWGTVRNAHWVGRPRADADVHAWFWAGLVPAAPPAWLPWVAGLTAMLRWRSGDGARAWCAVERTLEADPDNELADLMERLLIGAVAPAELDEWWDTACTSAS